MTTTSDAVEAIKAIAPLLTKDVAPVVIEASKGLPGEPNVLRFDHAGLNEAMIRVMKSIPEDQHVVAIARVDLDGGRLTIAGKIPAKVPGELGWTVMVDKPWKGALSAEAAVVWSF